MDVLGLGAWKDEASVLAAEHRVGRHALHAEPDARVRDLDRLDDEPPARAVRAYDEPSVFVVENLLREARRVCTGVEW